MEQLADRYDLLAVDLLGHGRTAAPHEPARYQMPAPLPTCCACWIDSTSPKQICWAISMGGRLALYLAAPTPIAGNHSPSKARQRGWPRKRPARPVANKITALPSALKPRAYLPFVDNSEKIALFASQKQLSPDVRAALRAQRLQNSPTGLANSLRGMGTGQQPSLWADLPTVSLPVLLLAGVLNEKFIRITVRWGRCCLRPGWKVTGAGHTTHLEQPQRFITAITAFLEQHNPQMLEQPTTPGQG